MGTTAPTPRPEGPSLSLASRIAGTLGVALLLLCASISYVLDNAVIRKLEEDLVHEIQHERGRMAAVIAEDESPDADLRDHVRDQAATSLRPRVLMRVRRDSEVVAASPGAHEAIPAGDPEAGFEWTLARDERTDRRGRRYLVEIYGEKRELESFVNHFRRNLVFLVTPLMGLYMVLAYWIVRRLLEPLEAVTAAAARMGSTTLGERIQPRGPDEVRRLAGSFNAMLARLEDAFRRMEEFGADLAHELRTPLQNLRGEAEVALLNPRSPAEYREILGAMIEECERLAKIVDDVLLLSRVERKEEALEIAPFDLAAEVEAVRDYFDDVAVGRGIALAARAPRPMPIRGDRAKLRRALANIVDNALKYTGKGGSVSLEATAQDGAGTEVVVADTGAGIAPEHIGRVFERFYRVEKSRSREFGGSGLGLGIARTIVRAHGGDVTLESVVGKGTTVRITLPA